jgi:ABC-type multidrug transport system ATPase subunit
LFFCFLRSQKPDIVAQKLRKVYDGGFVAVSELSFEVAQGMCFGLLGRNGNRFT